MRANTRHNAMQRAPWKKQIKMPTVFQWLTYIRFLWRSSGYRLPAGLVGGEVFSFASSKYIITTVLLSVFFFSGEGQDNQSIIGILAREHEMTSAVLI